MGLYQIVGGPVENVLIQANGALEAREIYNKWMRLSNLPEFRFLGIYPVPADEIIVGRKVCYQNTVPYNTPPLSWLPELCGETQCSL